MKTAHLTALSHGAHRCDVRVVRLRAEHHTPPCIWAVLIRPWFGLYKIKKKGPRDFSKAFFVFRVLVLFYEHSCEEEDNHGAQDRGDKAADFAWSVKA